MTPWKSISSCFRNCVNFSGRATASEFWWFTLFALVMLIFPFTLILTFSPWLAVAARRLHDTDNSTFMLFGWVGVAAATVVCFAVFIAYNNTSQVREVTETELGELFGYLAILGMLAGPFVVLGLGLVLLLFCGRRGSFGPNRYGPDPKRPELGMAGTDNPK